MILGFLVAVHFISAELTKFELINTIFEHLSPTLRINTFMVNAVIMLGVARGGTWAMVTKIYKFHVPPILPILQRGPTVE